MCFNSNSMFTWTYIIFTDIEEKKTSLGFVLQYKHNRNIY